MSEHLVQLMCGSERRVAVVCEPSLALLRGTPTVLALAERALTERRALTSLIQELKSTDLLSYDEIYDGHSEWKLVAPIDAPEDPHRVFISGTGLTHLGSARERQAMHSALQEAEKTDSMRMFDWGREHGRPGEGEIGIAPEWFYKGDGSMLRGPSAPLEIPSYAEDGGEEAEVAAVYLIARDGTPWRLGMTVANEFSDHVFERRNYLNLAGSKLRTSSIGPELVVGGDFDNIAGRVQVLRGGAVLWNKTILTGEKNMCHSLANIEHHHFKFTLHRQPGTIHLHFMGADRLSCGDGIKLEAGDVTNIRFEGFGRALRNVITHDDSGLKPVRVCVME